MKKTKIDFCGILNNSNFLGFWFGLSPKHIKSIRLNPNICKYWEFVELKVLGYGTKSDMTSKYGTIFIIITRHYKWEDFEIEAGR